MSVLASAAAGLLLGALSPAPASAQLDPLLSLKRVPPRVVIVFDTSFRMLDDGDGNYYDPVTYNVADDTAIASALGVASPATQYRRVYQGLNMYLSPAHQITRKTTRHDQHGAHSAPNQQRIGLVLAIQGRDAVEVRILEQTVEKLATLTRVVVIQHGDADVFHVE